MFIAANPSTLVNLARSVDREKEIADPRPPRRHADRGPRHPGRRSGRALASRAEAATRSGPRSWRRSPRKSGTLYPKDVWPADTTADRQLDRRQHRAVPAAAARATSATPPVRDLGLLASEGRMTHPVRRTARRPASSTSASHYFEFIPEAEIDSARRRRSSGPTSCEDGQELLHPADDDVRAVPLPHLRPGARHRLLRQDAAGRVPEQGAPLRQPDRREAVRVPRHAGRWTGCAQQIRPAADGVQLWPRAGTTRSRTTGCSSRSRTPRDRGLLRRFLAALDRALGEQNIEYAAKRTSGRLGPVRAHRAAGRLLGRVGPRPAREDGRHRRSSTSTRA